MTIHPQPLDLPSRQGRRDQIREYQMARAEERIRQQGRSIKCGRDEHHADQDGGCANDGTNCLCECHDPKGFS